MKIEKKKGIKITQEDGVPLSSGNFFYWDAQWSNIVLKYLNEYCPGADYSQSKEETDKFVTVFRKNTKTGLEICGTTKSIKDPKVKIPEADLKALVDSLDNLHKLSNDDNVAPGAKQFLRSFQLPNPNVMKDSWRVTTGGTKNLILLWGFNSKEKDATILPLTPTSKDWSDAGSRKDIRELLQGHTTIVKYDVFKIFKNILLFFSSLAVLLLLSLLCFSKDFGCKEKCDNCGGILGENQECQTCNAPVNPPVEKCECGDSTHNPDNNGVCPKCGGEISEGSVSGPSTEETGESDPSTEGTDEPGSSTEGTDEPGSSTKGTDEPPTCEKCGGELADNGECPKCAEDPDGPPTCEKCGGKLADNGECPKCAEDPEVPDEPPTCEKCGGELADNGECPNCDMVGKDFSFKVDIFREIDKGDKANVVFKVIPIKSLGDKKFEVESWEINGKTIDASSQKSNLTQNLYYKKRYNISAKVTIDGQQQKVIPYQWNDVNEPVWSIIRNNAGVYQLICSNSSRVKFNVQKWEEPKFYNDKYQDISEKFTSNSPVISGDNKEKIELSWKQDYIGTYFIEIEATVLNKTDPKKPKTFKVSRKFPLMNGSNSEALQISKIETAKDKVYHCLAKNTDGTAHNGTACAITDNYLLTNYHVAVGATDGSSTVDSSIPLELTNEKNEFYAKVISSNKEYDMALLEICDKNGNEIDRTLPSYFVLSDKKLSKNMRVFSLGYPAGTVRFGEPDFTEGKIDKEEAADICHFSQNAPGYSGGPLIALDQEFAIIGINKSGVVSEDEDFQGINFATSVKKVIELFPEISNAK